MIDSAFDFDLIYIERGCGCTKIIYFNVPQLYFSAFRDWLNCLNKTLVLGLEYLM